MNVSFYIHSYVKFYTNIIVLLSCKDNHTSIDVIEFGDQRSRRHQLSNPQGTRYDRVTTTLRRNLNLIESSADAFDGIGVLNHDIAIAVRFGAT